MQDITFGGLLTFYMKDMDMSIRDVINVLEQQGVNARYNTLYGYKTERSIPNLRDAQTVMKAFGNPLSDSEMEEVLETSKTSREDQPTKTSITRGIRINMSDFDDMDPSEFDHDIKIRISDLKFEKGIKNFNSYITYLIKKDMNETVWAGKEHGA